MADIISGVNGKVTVPSAAGGQTIQMFEWTATVERELSDVSTFDEDTNWRVKQGGIAHMTGSATGYFDADTSDTDKITAFATEDDAPTAAFKLVETTTTAPDKMFWFDGILGNVTVNVNKTGGPVTISFTFESSGPIGEDVDPDA